jgi:hypothetical protein
VKAADVERRANRTNWATFKDGKLLLDCTNIDDEAKRDEAEAHRITQQRNMEKILEENRIKE